MTHKKVYETFKDLFNVEDEEVSAWFQNGLNSIRVRNQNRVEFVFTYENDHDWVLETAEHFLKRLESNLKGDKK